MVEGLHRGGQLGTYCDGLAYRYESAGTGWSFAGCTAANAIFARSATPRAERAREAADLDHGSLEVESR